MPDEPGPPRLRRAVLWRARGLQQRALRTLATAHDQSVSVGDRVTFEGRCQVRGRFGGSVRVGDGCKIGHGALVWGQFGHVDLVGEVFIGPYCLLYGTGGLTIGQRTMVAGHTVIVASSHQFDDPDRRVWDQGYDNVGIAIGSDVWIGARCVVTDGVTIGDGAVIGAGSVVTSDIPPFAVAVGTPARVLRLRGEAKATSK